MNENGYSLEADTIVNSWYNLDEIGNKRPCVLKMAKYQQYMYIKIADRKGQTVYKFKSVYQLVSWLISVGDIATLTYNHPQFMHTFT